MHTFHSSKRLPIGELSEKVNVVMSIEPSTGNEEECVKEGQRIHPNSDNEQTRTARKTQEQQQLQVSPCRSENRHENGRERTKSMGVRLY